MRRGTRRTAAAIAAVSLLAPLLFVPGTTAKGKQVIDVRPGPNAIDQALDRANKGAKLRIHPGRYPENLEIDKRVKLVGTGKGRPVIDGECATRAPIVALANRVRLRKLEVVGGTGFEVDYNSVARGQAKKLVLRDTCDAAYGINVYDTGPMKIANSRASGFKDAGFYIGDITDTGRGSIRLKHSHSFGNLRGVIVENSAGGDIRVTRNEFEHNDLAAFGDPTGIYITNSDGVLVNRNRATENSRFGLHITRDSDRNVVNRNTFLGNPIDVRNEGSGNCGASNVFGTGSALPPC